MIVAGIDCSTKKIAIFVIDNGENVRVEIESNNKDTNMRINEMFLKVKTAIKVLNPDMVFVENSPYLQNIKVTLAIHSVVDAVRFACVLNNIPVQTVEVTSWKKSILGNGKVQKEAIMEFAKAKWGDLITNQDLADASCICQYGWIRMTNE